MLNKAMKSQSLIVPIVLIDTPQKTEQFSDFTKLNCRLLIVLVNNLNNEYNQVFEFTELVNFFFETNKHHIS